MAAHPPPGVHLDPNESPRQSGGGSPVPMDYDVGQHVCCRLVTAVRESYAFSPYGLTHAAKPTSRPLVPKLATR
jgi:hypothetical protein